MRASGATHRGVAIANGGGGGVFKTGSAKSGDERVIGRGDELVSEASRCSPRKAVVEEGQTSREARGASTNG